MGVRDGFTGGAVQIGVHDGTIVGRFAVQFFPKEGEK